jgi:GNAT superfamily N-acetyltransferase
MSISLPDLGVTGMTASRLDAGDLEALTALCIDCSDFFQAVEGRPGSRAVAEEILSLLPPGKKRRHKHLLGIVRDGALVGVADIGEDYPDTADWYVALFLLVPGSRRSGLGGQAWTGIERWIRRRGGMRIRLVVQQQNPGARRFWEAHGFVVEGETAQGLGNLQHRVWRLRKS